MECRHEKALRQVIQVLAQSEDIVAFPASTAVETSSLHSGAEAAD